MGSLFEKWAGGLVGSAIKTSVSLWITTMKNKYPKVITSDGPLSLESINPTPIRIQIPAGSPITLRGKSRTRDSRPASISASQPMTRI
jgi:hypothetical protein